MAEVGAMSAFAGEAQPVEVHHRGVWWAGELLGWRFESDGRCVARVRCVVDGLRHSAWMELADLRLPERATRMTASGIPGLRPGRPPLPSRRPAVPQHGRHRPDDDDTQPHLLLTGAFAGRPTPGGLRLPPSSVSRPEIGSRQPLSPV
jgi:hypothetical protein